jgi:hypothetical protein
MVIRVSSENNLMVVTGLFYFHGHVLIKKIVAKKRENRNSARHRVPVHAVSATGTAG